MQYFTFIISFFSNGSETQETAWHHDGLVFCKFQGSRTLTGWYNQDAMNKFRNHICTYLDAMGIVTIDATPLTARE